MTEPALRLSQGLSKFIVQRGLIGSRRGIALTQPQIHSRVVIPRHKRDEFGITGEGRGRRGNRKSQHPIHLKGGHTSEQDGKGPTAILAINGAPDERKSHEAMSVVTSSMDPKQASKALNKLTAPLFRRR